MKHQETAAAAALAACVTVTFAPMSFLDLEIQSAPGQVTSLESNNAVWASKSQVPDVHLFTGLRVYRRFFLTFPCGPVYPEDRSHH